MNMDPAALCIDRQRSIRQAVSRMNDHRMGLVLVVDDQRRLLGTVTDGDVRRAILANVDFQAPVTLLLEHKAESRYAQPITAPAGRDPNEYLALLQRHGILHLPILDEERRVVDVVCLHEFMPERSMQALIMAGGSGARLHPLTQELPKPMLPVGNRPLIEIMLEQLRHAGILRVHIATHHKAEKIHRHVGDGRQVDMTVEYVDEDRPLGTAGALGLMAHSQETVLVMNGDILTDVDFRSMLAYHREHGADLTIAVRMHTFEVPYGVLECDGVAVRGLTEKPRMTFCVNAGMYLVEPAVRELIPPGRRFDMTDLIQRLLEARRSVVRFPVHEYWLDIGQHEDYQRAQRDIHTMRLRDAVGR